MKDRGSHMARVLSANQIFVVGFGSVVGARMFTPLPGGLTLVAIVLITGALGVLIVWSAVALATPRYIVALARVHFAPGSLAALHPSRSTPVRA